MLKVQEDVSQVAADQPRSSRRGAHGRVWAPPGALWCGVAIGALVFGAAVGRSGAEQAPDGPVEVATQQEASQSGERGQGASAAGGPTEEELADAARALLGNVASHEALGAEIEQATREAAQAVQAAQQGDGSAARNSFDFAALARALSGSSEQWSDSLSVLLSATPDATSAAGGAESAVAGGEATVGGGQGGFEAESRSGGMSLPTPRLNRGPRYAAGDAEQDERPTVGGLDSASVTVDETGLIDLHVRQAELPAVLEMLSYQTREGIVASASVKGPVSANLFNATLTSVLDAIVPANGLAYVRTEHAIFVGTPEEVALRLPPPQTRIYRLEYIPKTEAIVAVQALLSPIGAVKVGGGDASDGLAGSSPTQMTSAPQTSSDYLIVTDTPEQLEQIGRLLGDIDVRPQQVLIEATILRATLNEDNEFGIDFTLLGGIDFQGVESTSNTSTNINTGPTPIEKLEQTTFNVNTDLLGNFPGGGFTFGIIKNNFGAFVRALEEVTDVAVIANPKIIALNRQEAEVIVGRRDGYLTTTVTETAAIQTVEFLETGTQIKFRPFINPNGSVTLSVHPKDSNGGLTSSNLPFEETTEATATILVEDGHTVLIGGLFRERNVSSKGQVPVLGNLPGLGLLFQHRSDQTLREEVIILLTVHVLKNTAAEAAAQRDLRADVERVRIGSRKGLLGFGRERLAQAFFQEALKQYDQGDFDLALLNVRMALHNAPRHVPAIKLKERLLGERMWDSDGTAGRPFLLHLLREEEGDDPDDLFGRPPLHQSLTYPGNPVAPPELNDPTEEVETQ